MPKCSGVVRTAWDSYRFHVLDVHAPALQVKDCRRAFYAGAEALLTEVMRGLSPGPDATDADEGFLCSLHDELMQFVAEVKAGKA